MIALSRRIALLPALLVLVLTLPLAYLGDDVLRRRATAEAGRHTEAMARRMADLLSARLQQHATELQLLARSQALQVPLDTARARAELEWLRRRSPDHAWIGVLDREGRVLVGSGGQLEGQVMTPQPMWDEGRRAMWIGDLRRANGSGGGADGGAARELVDLALPLRDATGVAVGVLAAQVDGRWLAQLRDQLTGISGTELALLGPDGTWRLAPLRASLAGEVRERLPAGVRTHRGADGHWLLAGAEPSEEPAAALRWQVLAMRSVENVAPPLADVRLALGAFGVGLSLLLALWAVAWARRLSGPYDGLIAAVTRARRVRRESGPAPVGLTTYVDDVALALQRHPAVRRAGDGGPVDATGEDDLVAHGPAESRASTADDGTDERDAELVVSPDAAFARLADEALRLRRVLDRLPVGVMILGPIERVLFWNRGCEALFQHTAEEVIGRSSYELLLLPAGLQAVKAVEASLRNGEMSEASVQLELRRKDGSHIWCEARGVPLRDADGRFSGFIVLLRDLTHDRLQASRARETEQRLAVLVEAAVDLVLARLDVDGRVTQWSASAQVLFGVDTLQILGRSIAGLFSFDDTDAGVPAALIEQARRAGRVEHEGWLLRHGSERFWGNLLVYRLDDVADQPGGFALVVRDLSERRATEQRLQQSEATLAAIIDSASDAVISTDVLGRVTLFNPAAERIFGISAEQMLGGSMERLLPVRHRQPHELHLARFATSSVRQRPMGRPGKVIGVRADGSEVHLEASISQSVVRSQKVLTAILRDVTDRVKAEQASRAHRQELSALTQRLMGTEQEGARRLAQVLHDQLGQTLTATRLSFDALQSVLQATLPRDGAAAGEVQLARLSRLIDRSISEVRQVLVDLRPALLQELGLSAAIDNEVRNQSQEAAGMLLVFKPDDSLVHRRWPPDVEYAMFMVAREALGNAIRHAGASEVHVTLSHGASDLVLTVHDDGAGMSEGLQRIKPGHLGLVGMRERAVAIGGQLHVASAPERGTTITLHWSPPT